MKKIEVELKVKKDKELYEIYLNDIRIDVLKNGIGIDNETLTWLNNILNTNMTEHQLQTHLIKNYLEKEKDIEEMTNEEFADYLEANINWLYRDGIYVQYMKKRVYRINNDNINFAFWNKDLLKDKISFCNFDNTSAICSKGNRKNFVNIVKQTIEFLEKLENFEIIEDGEG